MNCYTFDELLNSDWSDISGKIFKNMITNEIVGEIYSKYPTHCGKLSAFMNNGIIEFIIRISTIINFNIAYNINVDVTDDKYCTFLGTDIIDKQCKMFSVL